ncbi:MAG TPA: helix-turn-helix domain-containing protein [Clostridia bacterium]|nr:helix-turn-helix domain-containing protein [Clostridia bacterium]
MDYSRLDPSDVDALQGQLALYCSQSNLFSNMALCFPQKDFALSTRGAWKLSWLLTDEFAVEGMNSDDWLDLLYGKEKRFFLSNARMSTFGYARQGVLSIHIPIQSANRRQPLLAVLFWVDEAALRAYLQELAVFPGVMAFLQDEQGRTVALSGDAPDDQAVAFLSAGSQAERLEARGEAYRVLQAFAPSLGWRVTSLLPERTLFAQARQLAVAWLCMVGVLLVVGGALSYELALLNYRPLERIFRLFSPGEGARFSPTRDEMARVEALLSELMADQCRLRSRVESSRGLLQYAALAHLLQGEPAPDEDLMRTLDLPMPHARYSVGILRHSDPALAERVATAARALGFKAYWIRQEERAVLIFNHPQEQDLHALAERLSDLPAGMGLSNAHDGREKLPAARAEAQQALEYRPVRPDDRVVFFGEVQDAGFAIYYPLEKEQILLNSLRVGDADTAMEQFDALLGRNAEECRSKQALRMFMLAIRLTALKTDDADTSISRYLNALPEFDEDDPASMRRHAQALFERAAAHNARRAQAQRSGFHDQLRAYLDEHICDPQLSLKRVADHFEMSTAALSQVIKDQMRMGYLEYVNRKRVLLAKQMLFEGQCSVKVAAENVGFNNDVTFRRLFKKYEGVNPSQAQDLFETSKNQSGCL